MQPLVFISPVILTFIIFLVPSKIRNTYAIALTLLIAAVTTIPAVRAFSSGFFIVTGFEGFSLTFTIDRLSSFFIIVTNFTAITGMLSAGGFLKSYGKSVIQNSLHYFSYSWLHLSMLALLMLRDGIPFLIAWELMAVSSFMLILFDAEKREILKTAVNYLVQMHIGLVLLVIALLIVWKETGNMSFDALALYFSNHSNTGLFLLFFAGFAMKAGFIPFHTWLPMAHPAAPSHVSGFMSGVMIKMGIYGIFRVMINLQSDLYSLGMFIFVISSVSAVYGIMLSLMQNDLKKLLAYCSIENIGIIGIGAGVGMMGAGCGNEMMMVLGFTGSLLHVMNHSFSKSLLFFATGSVYMRYHTRNMEELGGVSKNMPRTALLFLIGSLAISALPVTGNFISEVLIYQGMFTGLSVGSPMQSLAVMAGIISLVLAGGLAIYTFVKGYGMTFSGTPRKQHENIREAGAGVLFPQMLTASLILLAGVVPTLFIRPILAMVVTYFPVKDLSSVMTILQVPEKIGLMMMGVIFLVLVILLIRKISSSGKEITSGPVWGCGYTGDASAMQYTGTSFSSNLATLAAPVVPHKTQFLKIPRLEIFPAVRKFSSSVSDFFRNLLFRITDGSMWMLKYLARLQTGHIQHYILYAFVFIVIIFFLLYLKIL